MLCCKLDNACCAVLSFLQILKVHLELELAIRQHRLKASPGLIDQLSHTQKGFSCSPAPGTFILIIARALRRLCANHILGRSGPAACSSEHYSSTGKEFSHTLFGEQHLRVEGRLKADVFKEHMTVLLPTAELPACIFVLKKVSSN